MKDKRKNEFLFEEEERKRFRDICTEIANRERQGIGTMKEKTIHAALKEFLEPDKGKQEQKVEGFVADIFTDGRIYEIQTRGFDKLRRKLTAFLPKYQVTVVYPVLKTKWLRWINEETGEVSAPRKSPKTGSGHELFPELYKVKMFLPNDHLSFLIVMLDAEEYRLLNGWSENKKKGSTRRDGIPRDIIGEIYLEKIEDYRAMIPETLPKQFTSADYRRELSSAKSVASVELNILAHIGAVKKVGKKGNSIIYEIGDGEE